MDIADFITPGLMVFVPLIVLLVLFDGTLKLLGMWRAARRNELLWFVLIALINTVGILPLIYLIVTKKQKEEKVTAS